ncbi:unnamed protein product [Citrullus colocynthis]|uniref:Uncharacterized protein n=1 Tax=Citrullus colocynthis TaxID=252529 RepID=A0ABP0Z928_9ROSI
MPTKLDQNMQPIEKPQNSSRVLLANVPGELTVASATTCNYDAPNVDTNTTWTEGTNQELRAKEIERDAKRRLGNLRRHSASDNDCEDRQKHQEGRTTTTREG